MIERRTDGQLFLHLFRCSDIRLTVYLPIKGTADNRGLFIEKWHFIGFKFLFKEQNQLFLIVISMWYDYQLHHYTHHWVLSWNADTVFHTVESQRHILHFRRCDLVSAHIDGVIAPTLEAQTPFIINETQVAVVTTPFCSTRRVASSSSQ